jgi:hypothetical protein
MNTITGIFDNFPDAVIQISEVEESTNEEASVAENSGGEQPDIYSSFTDKVEINY